jgi:hypothetical protein
MNYRVFLLYNPLLWIFLGGLFLGGVIAQLTIIPGRTRNPVKTRRRRPTKIFLLLACTVASATVAVFLAESGRPLGSLFLPAAPVAAAAGALGLRFKRLAGIPLLLLAFAAVYAGNEALRDWTPLYSSVQAGNIKVFRRGGDNLTLFISIPGRDEEIVEIPSLSFSLAVDFLDLEDYYFFLGRKHSYKIAGLKGQGETVYPVGPALGPNIFESYLVRMPGVRTRADELSFSVPKLYSTYTVVVGEKGLLSGEEN